MIGPCTVCALVDNNWRPQEVDPCGSCNAYLCPRHNSISPVAIVQRGIAWAKRAMGFEEPPKPYGEQQ